MTLNAGQLGHLGERRDWVHPPLQSGVGIHHLRSEAAGSPLTVLAHRCCGNGDLWISDPHLKSWADDIVQQVHCSL